MLTADSFRALKREQMFAEIIAERDVLIEVLGSQLDTMNQKNEELGNQLNSLENENEQLRRRILKYELEDLRDPEEE